MVAQGHDRLGRSAGGASGDVTVANCARNEVKGLVFRNGCQGPVLRVATVADDLRAVRSGCRAQAYVASFVCWIDGWGGGQNGSEASDFLDLNVGGKDDEGLSQAVSQRTKLHLQRLTRCLPVRSLRERVGGW
jgi:hypothetical protein